MASEETCRDEGVIYVSLTLEGDSTDEIQVCDVGSSLLLC